MREWLNCTHVGDCRELMRAMADDGVRVQTCVTSPPYFGLRDYGVEGQIGLEQTPGEYVERMLGATVVNQQEADRDIPKLIATPAAVRFVSCEPLLGPIDLDHQWFEAEFFGHADDCNDDLCALNADMHSCAGQVCPQPSIDWVIVGGESGPGARPMHPEWVRSIRGQCIDAHVPLHFKQWGEWAPNCLCGTRDAHRTTKRPAPGKPGVMFRCGREAAGRELDEKVWAEFP